MASENGNPEIVGILLDAGAAVNTELRGILSVPALIRASIKGHIDVVKLLLGAGANVHAETLFGKITALRMASENGHPEIVKLLKQHVVAQTLPTIMRRRQDRKNLTMLMNKKKVGNRGDGTMALELRHEIEQYLGGGKRRTTRRRRKMQRKSHK